MTVTDEMVEAAEAAAYGRHERGFINRPLIGAIDMRAAVKAALKVAAQAAKAGSDAFRETLAEALPRSADAGPEAMQTVVYCTGPSGKPMRLVPEADVSAAQAAVEKLADALSTERAARVQAEREREEARAEVERLREAAKPFVDFFEGTSDFWDDDRKIASLNYNFNSLTVGLFRRLRATLTDTGRG